jgi:hypothetical protein
MAAARGTTVAADRGADAMHGADAEAIVDAIDVYVAKRWPLGKEPVGKG